jgi:glycosyltransferase involved in cell wall biosynthesis
LTEDQYAKELNTSKVFLATSSQEGMPTSTLEAMASGCIVIGFSGIGGNDYMVGEGEKQNCILIENGNYPELGKQLEVLLLKLKENPFTYEQVIKNGIETALNFHDLEVEAKSLREFYKDL